MSEKKGGFGLFRKKEEEDLKKEEARAEEQGEKRRQATREKTDAEIRARHEERMAAAKAKREAEEQAERDAAKKHVVESGDTLTAIALKYYGNAGEFMKIYEANKEVIGDNPDRILVGMELIIPEL